MSEINPVAARNWERLPVERRAEITLILGQMAQRQLSGLAAREGDQDHDRDDGAPDGGRRLIALAGCR